MARFTGTVKNFNDDRGFGFIEADDAVIGDIFVHRTDIRRHKERRSRNDRIVLTEGSRVEFDVQPGEKGNRAVDVAEVG